MLHFPAIGPGEIAGVVIFIVLVLGIFGRGPLAPYFLDENRPLTKLELTISEIQRRRNLCAGCKRFPCICAGNHA